MNMKQVEALKKSEMAKLDALEAIVRLLEELRKSDKENGDDAVEWVLERLNEGE